MFKVQNVRSCPRPFTRKPISSYEYNGILHTHSDIHGKRGLSTSFFLQPKSVLFFDFKHWPLPSVAVGDPPTDPLAPGTTTRRGAAWNLWAQSPCEAAARPWQRGLWIARGAARSADRSAPV